MKSLRSLGVCPVVLILVTVAPGCGRSSVHPAHVKVIGKVVDAKGKPVPSLTVRFFPTEDVESFRVDKFTIDYPFGIANKDGTFALTMKGGDVDGARPGKYRVFFTGFSNEQKEKIPSKYQDADTSPLDVTVPNNDVNNLVLKLE